MLINQHFISDAQTLYSTCIVLRWHPVKMLQYNIEIVTIQYFTVQINL